MASTRGRQREEQAPVHRRLQSSIRHQVGLRRHRQESREALPGEAHDEFHVRQIRPTPKQRCASKKSTTT